MKRLGELSNRTRVTFTFLGDQLRRLAEEMRDQRQETVELVMQFVDGKLLQ